AWEGDVSDGLRFPTTYCLVSKISKRLDLEPNMNKVRQAMNIPPDFREWHWLLSEYRMEECGLPQARAIEIWKLFSPELVDQPDEMAEKVKSGAIPLSCARVKHVVGADSRNIYGMRNIRGDVRMSSLEKSKTSDLPCKDIFTRSIPSDERWTTANFDYKGSRSFKAWVAAVRRAKESSTRVKNSTSVHVHCPKDVKCDLIPIDIDVETEGRDELPKKVESNPSENVPMFDLLKSNFLSSSSACAGVIVTSKTNKNLSNVASSSAQLKELEKKNVDLADLLSSGQAHHKIETLDLKMEISLLKSSLALKYGEFDSTIAILNHQNEKCLWRKRKINDLSQSHDKMLSKTFLDDTPTSPLGRFRRCPTSPLEHFG
ncbi:PREDICTED: LOC110760952 partial, partial [Prunus dulcis]